MARHLNDLPSEGESLAGGTLGGARPPRAGAGSVSTNGGTAAAPSFELQLAQLKQMQKQNELKPRII